MHKLNKIVSAVKTYEGSGSQVHRLFPVRKELMNYDPFVLWDHFEISHGIGFPEHPHRGFEAITYIFNGSIEHKDNINNHSVVHPGGAQRFTAGKGVRHSEMSVEESQGIQVWVNLPQDLKNINPEYQQVNADSLPEEIASGVRIHKIVDGEESILLKTEVQFWALLFEQAVEHRVSIPSTHRGFVYVVEGVANVDERDVHVGDAFFFEQQTNEVVIRADANARVMMISGVPHRQLIYQHGPYVD